MISMIINILFFSIGKFVLNRFGIKEKERPVEDPLRIKRLEEIKNSTEVTGFQDNFKTKARITGVVVFLIMFICLILIV